MSKTREIQKLFAEMVKDKQPHTITELSKLAAENQIIDVNEKQLVRGAVSSFRKKHPEVIMLEKGSYQLSGDAMTATDVEREKPADVSHALRQMNERLDEIYAIFSSFSTFLNMNKNQNTAKAMEDYAAFRAFAQRVMEFETRYNRMASGMRD